MLLKLPLGLDRAIGITLINRIWVVCAGPLTLFFILKKLTPIEQGFYYTINSILGLQVFFELGLGFVILQTVSHWMAELHLSDGLVFGNEEKKSKLGRLLVDVLSKYALISFLFICFVLGFGFYFLSGGEGAETIEWKLAWCILVPIFGLSIISNAIFSYLEGMGFVQDVALARLVQSVTSISLLCISLFIGMGLGSLAIMHGVNLLIACLWIVLRYHKSLLPLAHNRAPKGAIRWMEEIWPFQWRVAISWVAGYLGSLAITPIVFHRLGAIEAGKIGLSITLMGAITSGALAWVTTKSPKFGRLAAQREFCELIKLYKSSRAISLVVGGLAVIVCILVVFLMSIYWPSLAMRFVSVEAMGMLGIVALMNIQISSCALLLRSFRREPFVAMSVVIGLVTALATYIVSGQYNLNTVVFLYMLILVSGTFLWCNRLFSISILKYTS